MQGHAANVTGPRRDGFEYMRKSEGRGRLNIVSCERSQYLADIKGYPANSVYERRLHFSYR